MSSTKRITRISPLPAAKLLGVLYAIIGAIFGLFAAIALLIPASTGSADEAALAGFGIIIVPVLAIVGYGLIGFLAGLFISALYNLIAKWLGGIEIEIK